MLSRTPVRVKRLREVLEDGWPIREYIEGHSRTELLDHVLDEELPRYAEALERLRRGWA